MNLFSTRSYGIRWILVRYGIREDIYQELDPVFTLSPPSYPEGLANEGNATHNIGERHYCTGGVNRVCLGFRFLLLGLSK